MTDRARHEPLAYRADIDGLRAIAVVAVVLFHAKLPFLTGGYVGVDVFFVISGFLITAILLQDHSIVRFYRRRAQRILPALFALVATVLTLGALLLLLPHDLMSMAWSSVATMLFGSNIWFWRQSGYFTVQSELWPLLHTWSLGVEEQFYLAFPILIKIVHRLRRSWLAALFGGLAAVSLASSVFSINHVKAVLAFYMMPLRAWELLVGAVLATSALSIPVGARIRAVIAGAGIAAICWSVVTYTPDTLFPGWGAVPPVLGTALVIWAGQRGEHPLSSILGCAPLRGIGLISYSLYLWHWPVLAFARYVAVRELTGIETASAIVAMGVLAFLSWRYVERPFRGRLAGRTIWIASASGIALLLAASLALVASQGWPRRFSPAVVALNAEEGETWRCPVTRMVVFGGFYGCPLSSSIRRPEDAEIVLWGDSHAQMYAPALMRRKILLINANSCAPVLGDAINRSCGEVQRGNYANILKLPAKTVVIAQSWVQYRDETGLRLGRPPKPEERYADAVRRLRALVVGLRENGKQVIILSPVPVPEYNVASVVARDLAFHGRITTPTGVTHADYEREYANVLVAMNELAQLPGVRVLHIDRWVCRNGRCPFIVDGRAVFADFGHYTTWFSTNMKPFFDHELNGADPK